MLVAGSLEMKPPKVADTTREARVCVAVQTACKTEKGLQSKAKQRPVYLRNAGVAAFMSPCGIVVGCHELYGSER